MQSDRAVMGNVVVPCFRLLNVELDALYTKYSSRFVLPLKYSVHKELSHYEEHDAPKERRRFSNALIDETVYDVTPVVCNVRYITDNSMFAQRFWTIKLLQTHASRYQSLACYLQTLYAFLHHLHHWRDCSSSGRRYFTRTDVA